MAAANDARARRGQAPRGAVVLEDDVALDPAGWCAFAAALERLRATSFEWDVIYLDAAGHTFLGDDIDATAAAERDHGVDTGDFSAVGFAYGAWATVLSARGARRLARSGFERCLMPVDEFLPFLYGPAGHPRAGEFRACLDAEGDNGDLAEAADPGGAVPPPVVALRWRGADRGAAVVRSHGMLGSDIEPKAGSVGAEVACPEGLAAAGTNVLPARTAMRAGGMLESANGRARLALLRPNGLLVLLAPVRAQKRTAALGGADPAWSDAAAARCRVLWSSGDETFHERDAADRTHHLVLHDNGNLMILQVDAGVTSFLWESSTDGTGAVRAELRDDCNLARAHAL